MLVRCPTCGLRFVVPEERAKNPKLKARCRCGAEFPVHAVPSPATGAAAKPALSAPPLAGKTPGPDALRSGAWKKCTNHPQARSESACSSCGVGFCRDCEQRVRNVPVCPLCQGLCTDAVKVEEDLAREKQRARTMQDDLGFIAGYPFTDRIAYVMLAVFTWIFSFFSGFAMGVVLSKGVLIWYGFTALTKVSIGKFRGYMPNFGDITDIVHPMRLSFAAALAAGWPLLVVWYFFGLPTFLQQARGPDSALVHAQDTAADEPTLVEEPAESGEEAAPSEEPGAGDEAAPVEEAFDSGGGEPNPLIGLALFGIAALWYLLYMPMALIVAAISRGFFKTLNPIIGVDAIGKMGGAYWFAAGIYLVLTLVQGGLDRLLAMVPIAGSLVGSFVAAYVSLTTGCALGLAVFKKAKALDLD